MINWNFQRKQMRENMRKNMTASEEVIITNSRNTPTYFGEIYLYGRNFSKSFLQNYRWKCGCNLP
jgi:hypothetical protein